ncbi:hypothetical protein [Roseovarius sp. E0-M6]|uniref:hypothetical protein n=1 Tax=Roseovarius sp. E0-M6 TaxID=3127118 RepID=UPI003010479D
MFGWLFKKNVYAQQGKKEITQPSRDTDLTSAIKQAIGYYLEGNAKPSLLYAKAAGYTHDVIKDDELTAFLECLRIQEAELEYDQVNAAEAWFEEDFDFVIRSKHWEMLFFNLASGIDETKALEEIEQIRRNLQGKRVSHFWQDPQVSIGEYALAKAKELKKNDLDRIFSRGGKASRVREPLGKFYNYYTARR